MAAITLDVFDLADAQDARLVQAAQTAGSNFFITGHRRVLVWGQQGDIQQLSPRVAWRHLFAKNSSI